MTFLISYYFYAPLLWRERRKMNFILPYFIILLLLFQFYLKKNSKKPRSDSENFLNRESLANQTRKKDISKLDYITIPDDLPFPDTDIDEVKRAQQSIADLKDKKILNLSGFTNTDLKLKYGAANLTALSEYDENFSTLCRSVVNMAAALKKNGFDSEAEAFLEFGIECGSDVSSNYVMLAEYYLKNGNENGLSHLKARAESLTTMSKSVILKKLGEMTDGGSGSISKKNDGATSESSGGATSESSGGAAGGSSGD